MQRGIYTGCRRIDGFIAGSRATLFYGPAGSGKTSILLHIAANTCRGSRCIYISTEGSLYYERVARTPEKYSGVFFTEYNEFDELFWFVLTKLYYMPVDLVFIDSINALYRVIVYEEYSIEKLGLLLAVLRRMAESGRTMIFASAQVRAGFEEDKEEMTASGMSILDYWFDVIIRTGYGEGGRTAVIVKPVNGSDRPAVFMITDVGVEWLDGCTP